MIQKVEMYTVKCDNFGKTSGENSEYSCWNDEGFVRDDSHENGWITEDEKDYCPDCFFHDDDDNLVLKPVKS